MNQLFLAVTILNGIDPNVDGIDSVPKLIANLIQIALFFAGALSVIFLIVGGLQVITSTGNPQRLAKAKSTLTWAVLGLVVAISAFAIVNFVTGMFFK